MKTIHLVSDDHASDIAPRAPSAQHLPAQDIRFLPAKLMHFDRTRPTHRRSGCDPRSRVTPAKSLQHHLPERPHPPHQAESIATVAPGGPIPAESGAWLESLDVCLAAKLNSLAEFEPIFPHLAGSLIHQSSPSGCVSLCVIEQFPISCCQNVRWPIRIETGTCIPSRSASRRRTNRCRLRG